MSREFIHAHAEGETWKNISRGDVSNDCLGAAVTCFIIILVFIFYASVSGFFIQ